MFGFYSVFASPVLKSAQETAVLKSRQEMVDDETIFAEIAKNQERVREHMLNAKDDIAALVDNLAVSFKERLEHEVSRFGSRLEVAEQVLVRLCDDERVGASFQEEVDSSEGKKLKKTNFFGVFDSLKDDVLKLHVRLTNTVKSMNDLGLEQGRIQSALMSAVLEKDGWHHARSDVLEDCLHADYSELKKRLEEQQAQAEKLQAQQQFIMGQQAQQLKEAHVETQKLKKQLQEQESQTQKLRTEQLELVARVRNHAQAIIAQQEQSSTMYQWICGLGAGMVIILGVMSFLKKVAKVA